MRHDVRIARTENAPSPLSMLGNALCVSGRRSRASPRGGGRREIERQRVRNGERVRCVCSTQAIVREDYLSIVCRSLALSLSTAAATPVVQYLTSRPALFRGFCATRKERRLRSRERERDPPIILLFFGYLAESGPTPFRILTKIVTSHFASTLPPYTYTIIHIHCILIHKFTVS